MEQTDASKRIGAFAACAAGQAIWGCSFLFSKIALQVTGPTHLLALRFDIAVIFMLILCALKKGELHFIKKIAYWKLILLYMVLQAAYYVCETYGLYYTNSEFAGAFMALIPIFASVIAAIFLKEYPPLKKILFSIIPIIGVIVMTIAGNSIGIVTMIGVVFLFLTCMSGGATRTLNVGMSRYVTPFERTFLVMIAGAICNTSQMMVQLHGDVRAYLAPLRDMRFTIPVLLLVLFCSFAANMLVNYSARYTTVMQMSALSNVNPLCSVLCGVFLLKEPMTVAIFVGCVLIISGIWLVIKPEAEGTIE